MRRSQRERAFQESWGDLATYNAEKARGIVHTAEWDAKMAEKQARYNDGLRAVAVNVYGWDPAETHPEDFTHIDGEVCADDHGPGGTSG